MHGLKQEAQRFRAEKSAETADARQRAALRLCCGIDLDQLEQADLERRAELIGRIQRAIERERLKGTRMHWSYDLNRHIALKQALDRFRPANQAMTVPPRQIPRRHRHQVC